jgi:hypothetical protein
MKDVPGPKDELLEGIPLYRVGGVVDPVAPTPPSLPRDPGPSGRGGPEHRDIDVNSPAEAPTDP